MGESLAQLTDPGLHRFRAMLQLSAFPLLRAHRVQAPHMLFIRPIDGEEGSKLWLLLDEFDFGHRIFSSVITCETEGLALLPRKPYS